MAVLIANEDDGKSDLPIVVGDKSLSVQHKFSYETKAKFVTVLQMIISVVVVIMLVVIINMYSRDKGSLVPQIIIRSEVIADGVHSNVSVGVSYAIVWTGFAAFSLLVHVGVYIGMHYNYSKIVRECLLAIVLLTGTMGYLLFNLFKMNLFLTELGVLAIFVSLLYLFQLYFSMVYVIKEKGYGGDHLQDDSNVSELIV